MREREGGPAEKKNQKEGKMEIGISPRKRRHRRRLTCNT